MGERLVIDLTFPPSVNRIWRYRQGRKKPYLDSRYTSWKRVSDNLCLAAGWHKTPISGRFAVHITLSDKRRRGDADNRVKPVLDWLQQAAIIENDSLADSVSVSWGYAPEGCRVELTSVGAERRAA